MNAINSWNPLREMEDIQDRVLRALRPSLGGRPSNGHQSLAAFDWSPSVDISEDPNEYLIKVELPEVKKEDVKVTVENGVVSIRGERKFEKEEKDKKYHRVERCYGSFLRTFSLPDDAEPDKVTAEFKEGLLLVSLVKSEAKKPRQIDVQVS